MGQADEKRLEPAMSRCSSLGNVSRERSPAVFVRCHNMCISGELDCSFARDAPAKADTWHNREMLHQSTMTHVRHQDDF